MKNIITFIVVVIILILLFACSRAQKLSYEDGYAGRICQTPIAYVISSRFSYEERDRIIKSFEYWDTALHKNTFVFLPARYQGYEVPSGFIWVDKSSETKNCGRTEFLNDSAWCTKGAAITLNKTCLEHASPAEQETIVRHEVGHILGLGHTSWSNDLMWPVLIPDDPLWPHPRSANPEELKVARENQ